MKCLGSIKRKMNQSKRPNKPNIIGEIEIKAVDNAYLLTFTDAIIML